MQIQAEGASNKMTWSVLKIKRGKIRKDKEKLSNWINRDKRNKVPNQHVILEWSWTEEENARKDFGTIGEAGIGYELNSIKSMFNFLTWITVLHFE
jgi:hypothetical protein